MDIIVVYIMILSSCSTILYAFWYFSLIPLPLRILSTITIVCFAFILIAIMKSC
jgi:hypothetical protein